MIIAIDGLSSCGKSTLSKKLASILDFNYIDSGAMYRAVTYHILKNDIQYSNLKILITELDKLEIHFCKIEGENICFLNGKNVEKSIRSMEVSNLVSTISAIPEVRTKCVQLQRKMAIGRNVVMDGRDIGTNVFPDADCKIFVIAETNIRAQRRFNELKHKGIEVTLEEVLQNLNHRDKIDSTRKHSPLQMANDAFLLDNTHISKEEQVDVVINHLKSKSLIC